MDMTFSRIIKRRCAWKSNNLPKYTIYPVSSFSYLFYSDSYGHIRKHKRTMLFLVGTRTKSFFQVVTISTNDRPRPFVIFECQRSPSMGIKKIVRVIFINDIKESTARIKISLGDICYGL